MTYHLAYVAGLIDGEGTFNITRRSHKHRSDGGRGVGFEATITVANTHLGVLLGLKSQFGGAVGSNKRSQAHHKLGYSWELTGRRAETLARELLPYLVIKLREAEEWLAFRQLQRDLWLASKRRKRGPRDGAYVAARYTEEELARLDAARLSVFGDRRVHPLRKTGAVAG